MRGTRRLAAAALATMLLGPGAGGAEAGAQVLAPGARIKARTLDGLVQGTVVQVADTALVLERRGVRDTVAVAYGRVADVRMAVWKERSTLASALLWAAGAVAGIVVIGQVDPDHPTVVAGSLLGLGLGQLIKTDHWVAVPVTPGERLARGVVTIGPGEGAARSGAEARPAARTDAADAAAAEKGAPVAPAAVPVPVLAPVPAEVGEPALEPV